MIAAVHVTKGIGWKGHVEEFENVYHYDTPAISTDSGWDELIDAVVAAEKVMHTASVSFLRARVHGPTDTTEAADIMRRVRDLTGNGSGSTTNAAPPELSIVCSLYMGRSPAGYKRFLRKYYHGGVIGGTGASSGMGTGTVSLGSSQKAIYITQLTNLKNVAIGAGANALCTPKGIHIPVGEDWKVSDYAATRQFKRGRKER